MEIDERLIELETRLTHMDDTVELLNGIVTQQQLKIDTLERLVQRIAADYNEFKEQLAPEITDTKPPHY